MTRRGPLQRCSLVPAVLLVVLAVLVCVPASEHAKATGRGGSFSLVRWKPSYPPQLSQHRRTGVEEAPVQLVRAADLETSPADEEEEAAVATGLSVPLHHNTAEYFVEVSLAATTQARGNAGAGMEHVRHLEHFLLHVDTGSAVMALPSQQCDGCCALSYRYERENERGLRCGGERCGSGACRGDLCGFEMTYADRSRIEGVLVQDRVVLGDLAWDVTFGAIAQADRFCVRGVDGILGLARPGTSTFPLNCVPTCVEPPLDSLVRERDMRDIFALQLRETGGRLSLGEALQDQDAAMWQEPVAWVPDLGAHAGHYRIAVRAITVAFGGGPVNYHVDLPTRGVTVGLLDSGASVIAASAPLYRAIVAAFLAGDCTTLGLCTHARESGEHVFQYCFARDTLPVERYPAFNLTLAHGVTLSLLPRHYLVPRLANDGTHMVCSAIRETKASHADLVLGAPFFRGFYTVFDRENGRIGFAEHADGEGGLVTIDPTYQEPVQSDIALQTSWENGAGLWIGLSLLGGLVAISTALVCTYAQPPRDINVSR